METSAAAYAKQRLKDETLSSAAPAILKPIFPGRMDTRVSGSVPSGMSRFCASVNGEKCRVPREREPMRNLGA